MIKALLSLSRLFIIKILHFKKFHFKNSRLVSRINVIFKNDGEITFGSRLHLRAGSRFICDGGKIVIGDNVFINYNTIVTSLREISIGNNVSIGPNVCIFDHDHAYKSPEAHFVSEKIQIGDNVWIGAGVTILKGSVIGKNSVIGAGTVVKGVIPQDTLVYNKTNIVQTKIVKE